MEKAKIDFLLRRVEGVYGKKVQYASDFDLLSTHITEKTEQSVSPSTLKRIWGYVTMEVKPRIYTLDVLAKYCGFKDYQTLVETFEQEALSSGFFSDTVILSQNLVPGNKLKIGWEPDRICLIEFQGDNTFIILSVQNSMLKEKSTFETSALLLNSPLYMVNLKNSDEVMGTYVAGKITGLTTLKHER